MLSYIIPPYLLNTSTGSNLKKELTDKSEELSRLNVIDLNSRYFYHPVKSCNNFSNDHYLNLIIKEKLVYKLAIIGVLGNNPMEFTQYNDDYIYELYEIFKSRIIQEKGEHAGDKQTSFFYSTKLGEVEFANKYPKEYDKYLFMSLKDLIIMNNSNHDYKLPPSFIDFGNSDFFNYTLPISWVPLITKDYLEYLNKGLRMEIHNQGFSTINFTSSDFECKEDWKKSRFYNFITDKPIESSSGVFYYEVEVEQYASRSTNFRTIISMDDPAISSNLPINFSAGFVKRHFNIDGHPVSTNTQLSLGKIDLEQMKKDLFYNEINEDGMEDMKILLSSRPGDFKGSFAVSFEDAVFYNSIKTTESLQRAQILNMNRRLGTLNRANETDSGKVDIGVPFKTKLANSFETNKVYKTDTVGMGINFVDKSIFLTLNGVLISKINEKELTSNNPANENLFVLKDKKNFVYPMIGFKINDLDISKGEPSTANIKTNFGFQDFKFDISNYVDNIKRENQKHIEMLEDITKKNETENAGMIHKLIKGYLIQEGYLNTFKAFESDLKVFNEFEDDIEILSKSHALNRQIIKEQLTSKEFSKVIQFLQSNYNDLFFKNVKGSNTIFEIKLAAFTYSLKQYIVRKLNLNNLEFEFEHANTETELHANALQYRQQLLNQYPDKQEDINHLSSILLVDSKLGFDNLPKVKSKILNFDTELSNLSNEINRAILSSVGMNNTTNLENIIDQVNENIDLLSIENDEKFMLVNFDQDYL